MIKYAPFFSLMLFIVAGCVPVNSCFDSAHMLDKKEASVTGGYSDYLYRDENGGGYSNYNYGVTLGYGINADYNIRLHYELIDFPHNHTDYYHYADVEGKINIIRDRLAGNIPIGIYFTDGQSPSYVLSPRMIFSYPVNVHLEPAFSIKTDIFFNDDDDRPVGITMGSLIGKDIRQWAVIPEIAMMFNTSEEQYSFTYGIGFQYSFKPFAK